MASSSSRATRATGPARTCAAAGWSCRAPSAAGSAAGLRALAGTIVALGALGAHPGAGMRRASIVAMTSATPLPTYARACAYRPAFLRLCLRRLRALGLPVTDEQIEGRYSRWSGDGLELGRAEILILDLERPEADRRHQSAGLDAPRR